MSKRIIYHKIIRPHSSMGIEGQKVTLYILLAFLLVLAPPMMAMGAWVGLLFLFSPVAMMVIALRRNNFDKRLSEEMILTRERLHLQRIEARGAVREFESDPYWVKVELRDDGPVEKYLTLRDKDRMVEFGAFLSPDERLVLYGELQTAIARARRAQN